MRIIIMLLTCIFLAACAVQPQSTSVSEMQAEVYEKVAVEEIKPEEIVSVAAEKTDPALIGEWVEYSLYSPESESYEKVYYKVKSITWDAAPLQSFDKTGELHPLANLTPKEDENLVNCVVEYEVHFPDKFVGEASPNVSFEIVSETGIIEAEGSVYPNITRVFDVSANVQKYRAKQTFTHGYGVFSMIRDYTDFVLVTTHYEGDTLVYSYVDPNVVS